MSPNTQKCYWHQYIKFKHNPAIVAGSWRQMYPTGHAMDYKERVHVICFFNIQMFALQCKLPFFGNLSMVKGDTEKRTKVVKILTSGSLSFTTLLVHYLCFCFSGAWRRSCWKWRGKGPNVAVENTVSTVVADVRILWVDWLFSPASVRSAITISAETAE